MEYSELINKDTFSRSDIIALLSADDAESLHMLQKKAEDILIKHCGNKVNLRGLIEFSNYCINDCYYCGIRKSNSNVTRYELTKEEIIETAAWCANMGYGSIALQSGDRNDAKFIDFVEDVLTGIKDRTKSDALPEGLGITLCIGEQTHETYKRLFDAGAHRYLLRIETSNKELFRQLHPEKQKLENRIKCLKMLHDIGYQVGTGVMIGLPGQTIEELADDILFFRDMDIDMFGMGPYIVHPDTPMNKYHDEMEGKKHDVFTLALKMIATVRIVLKDVNIASTTALQAMYPDGREQGLLYGANVIMPLMTPENIRHDYLLYEGKPGLDDLCEITDKKVRERIISLGREINYNTWGDSRHFFNRR